MKVWMISLATALLLPTLSMRGQTGASSREGQNRVAQFAGVWRGQLDNLPGVDLVITDEVGQLHGAVLFYLHIRPDADSPYTSRPGLPEPMIDLKLDGQTLKFEISHRRAHPPRTLRDLPMTFYLKITGPNKAELLNETEGDGPTVLLTRSDY